MVLRSQSMTWVKRVKGLTNRLPRVDEVSPLGWGPRYPPEAIVEGNMLHGSLSNSVGLLHLKPLFCRALQPTNLPSVLTISRSFFCLSRCFCETAPWSKVSGGPCWIELMIKLLNYSTETCHWSKYPNWRHLLNTMGWRTFCCGGVKTAKDLVWQLNDMSPLMFQRLSDRRKVAINDTKKIKRTIKRNCFKRPDCMLKVECTRFFKKVPDFFLPPVFILVFVYRSLSLSQYTEVISAFRNSQSVGLSLHFV